MRLTESELRLTSRRDTNRRAPTPRSVEQERETAASTRRSISQSYRGTRRAGGPPGPNRPARLTTAPPRPLRGRETPQDNRGRRPEGAQCDGSARGGAKSMITSRRPRRLEREREHSQCRGGQ